MKLLISGTDFVNSSSIELDSEHLEALLRKNEKKSNSYLPFLVEIRKENDLQNDFLEQSVSISIFYSAVQPYAGPEHPIDEKKEKWAAKFIS